MSRGIKSDGEVNAMMQGLARTMRDEPRRYTRAKVDEVIVTDALKQCELPTLTDLFAAYHTAFRAKNWAIYEHIRIKGDQSSVYRKLRIAAVANIEDPLGALILRTNTPVLTANDVTDNEPENYDDNEEDIAAFVASLPNADDEPTDEPADGAAE